MKPAQHLYGIGNCLGCEQASAKNPFAQPSHLAVFMNFAKCASGEARYLQSNGVRSDIDRG
jgi:hypothetical protein